MHSRLQPYASERLQPQCIQADRHGSTAMMWAAGGGHLMACMLLAELGE